jgi:hypothetical protein
MKVSVLRKYLFYSQNRIQRRLTSAMGKFIFSEKVCIAEVRTYEAQSGFKNVCLFISLTGRRLGACGKTQYYSRYT